MLNWLKFTYLANDHNHFGAIFTVVSDESMMISDESGPIGDQTTKLVENTKNNN